jgi:hypothetical protein
VKSGSARDSKGGADIDHPRDVARRLAACWSPPEEKDGVAPEVTLRLQFSRSGAVIGEPRITYVRAGGGGEGRAAVVRSIRTALDDCTPLRFTGSLGAAIAGYPFAIRFMAARHDPDKHP